MVPRAFRGSVVDHCLAESRISAYGRRRKSFQAPPPSLGLRRMLCRPIQPPLRTPSVHCWWLYSSCYKPRCLFPRQSPMAESFRPLAAGLPKSHFPYREITQFHPLFRFLAMLLSPLHPLRFPPITRIIHRGMCGSISMRMDFGSGLGMELATV